MFFLYIHYLDIFYFILKKLVSLINSVLKVFLVKDIIISIVRAIVKCIFFPVFVLICYVHNVRNIIVSHYTSLFVICTLLVGMNIFILRHSCILHVCQHDSIHVTMHLIRAL